MLTPTMVQYEDACKSWLLERACKGLYVSETLCETLLSEDQAQIDLTTFLNGGLFISAAVTCSLRAVICDIPSFVQDPLLLSLCMLSRSLSLCQRLQHFRSGTLLHKPQFLQSMNLGCTLQPFLSFELLP